MTLRAEPVARFDLGDPEFHRNPYAVYEALRARGPLQRGPHGQWLACGFELVSGLLMDERVSADFSAEPKWLARRGGSDGPLMAGARHWMLLMDDPAHRTARAPFGRHFTPRRVQQRRTDGACLAEEALDRLPATGTFDVVADFAEPIAAAAARDLFGLPQGRERDYARWSSTLIRMADPISPSGTRAAIGAAMEEAGSFVRRAWSDGDLRPDGVAAKALEGAEPGSAEGEAMVAGVVQVLTGAVDTTADQITSAVLALLRHPDQLALVSADPHLAEQAVTEFVRYDSPVQLVVRRLTADLDTPYGTMRRGEKVMLLLAAANRDPDRYPDPDRLWLSRPDVAPLGFGHGPHFCLGMHQAKVTVGLAVGALVRRYRGFVLAEDVLSWRESVIARRVERLRVAPRGELDRDRV